jgi:hypothetical protein
MRSCSGLLRTDVTENGQWAWRTDYGAPLHEAQAEDEVID